MHELIACTASMIILTLLIAQTAANTNTFIEAAYCERTIAEYVSQEYKTEEMQDSIEELRCELERMPGVRAEVSGDKLDIYLDGIIGPAGALGIEDNTIHIEKDLELKIKEEENEQSDNYGGADDHADAFEQDADGDEYDDDQGDVED